MASRTRTGFTDNLLVFGEDDSSCLVTLEKVFARLRKANVQLNQSKCCFMQSSTEYLGHVVSGEGIHPMMDKVQAIREAPTPTNVSDLKSFLGIANYYGKFVPKLGNAASSLVLSTAESHCLVMG